MKCTSEICANYNPNCPHCCEWHDAVELDISGKCDLFVLADDAFIYEREAERKYALVEKRRQQK